MESSIILAGKSWPVPLLAPRQNRIVIPALLRIGAAPPYDLLLDIVFAALTRAHPDVAREDFENWPVAHYELLDALPVIANQTGFLESKRTVIAAGAGRRAGTEPPEWDAIIAQFVNFLPGTTPDYWEDGLTAPRLSAMQEEWRKHPPLAVLAAGWLGYKPKPRDSEALDELLRLFPGGHLRVN